MAGKPDRNRHKEEINREQNKEEQINKEEANKEVNEDKKRSPGNPEQKSDNAKSPGEKSNPEKENESDPEDVEKPQPRIDMAPDNNSGPKKPIPALKCSQCAYILRYQEDCPRCGVSFSTILAHWRRNV